MHRLFSAILLAGLATPAAWAHSDPGAFAQQGAAPSVHAAEQVTRYPAQVRLDPRHIVGVVLKVNARIVNMRDLYVGRHVEQGEVLAEFESAELETIQRTYAETYRSIEYVRAFSTTADEKLIEAQMNLLWRGLSETDLRDVERTAQPVRTVAVTAPREGYLVEIGAAQGQVVNPGAQSGLFSLSGTTLFRIADQDGVLIETAVPLDVATTLRPGDVAGLHLDANGSAFAAMVDEIVPYTPPGALRRMVRLRPLAGAALLGLRNGMRATVSFDQASHEGHAHAH